MEKQFTPQESLQVITEMINSRKQKYNENGFIIRFWGWLVIIAALGQIVLISLKMYDICWITWLLMPLGAIFTSIYKGKKCKHSNLFVKKGKEHLIIDENNRDFVKSSGDYGWIIFGINAMLLGFVGVPFLFGINFIGILLLLMGFASMICGIEVKFKPSIYAGILCNILAFLAFAANKYWFNNEWDVQLIILIVAIFATNIIPGYILKSEFNKNV